MISGKTALRALSRSISAFLFSISLSLIPILFSIPSLNASSNVKASSARTGGEHNKHQKHYQSRNNNQFQYPSFPILLSPSSSPFILIFHIINSQIYTFLNIPWPAYYRYLPAPFYICTPLPQAPSNQKTTCSEDKPIIKFTTMSRL